MMVCIALPCVYSHTNLRHQARDSAAAGVAKVEATVEATASQVAAKVGEARDWVEDKVEEAGEAWMQEITPQNEEESLMEQGLIPSNTEEVLARGGE